MSRLFTLLLLALAAHLPAQPIAERWLKQAWTARWVYTPQSAPNAHGVYLFRRTFSVSDTHSAFVVHVSGDNRYRLWINGHEIGEGPCRSDLGHWNFETYDLSPYLRTGDNVLAAEVWNWGDNRPFFQQSHQSGFLVQGNGEREVVVNTGSTDWKTLQNQAFSSVPHDLAQLQTYIVVAEGDRIDGTQHPWGWEQRGFDDSRWPSAQKHWFPAKPRGVGSDGNWMLTPRTLPGMWSSPERFQRIRRSESGTLAVPDSFLQGKSPILVPPNTQITLLIDQGYLTNAYPELYLQGGAGASVTATYAEALVDSARQKGHRDRIEGKHIMGITDQFLGAGGTEIRCFRPLFFRTFRYIQLHICTAQEPLTICDYYGVFTGYPFKENARFSTDQAYLSQIWTVGWRTARLCAGETYYDCPYYEQMQYIGDTRIQALISLYVSGDDRLMRKSIDDMAHSFLPEGLTQSRYPSRDPQVIPPFSLFWVNMVRDYLYLRPDTDFAQGHFEGVNHILTWYEARIGPNGLLGPIEWWPFADWSWPWSEADAIGGIPPGAKSGGSCLLSLQYAYTLREAAFMFRYFRDTERAAHYFTLADRINSAARQLCYDAEKGVFADTPERLAFSQHTNIMAVLSGAVPAEEQRALLQRVLHDESLLPCTYYFRFYLFEALKKANMGDEVLAAFQPWQRMLDLGLSTFAETAEPTRSDCHAWSASPLFEMLATTAGIRSTAPGFMAVEVAPAMGTLRQLECSMPHPDGSIEVSVYRTDSGDEIRVTLPPSVSGRLVWQGKRKKLRGGENKFNFAPQ
jgi:alpha-L-rhamnosidase